MVAVTSPKSKFVFLAVLWTLTVRFRSQGSRSIKWRPNNTKILLKPHEQDFLCVDLNSNYFFRIILCSEVSDNLLPFPDRTVRATGTVFVTDIRASSIDIRTTDICGGTDNWTRISAPARIIWHGYPWVSADTRRGTDIRDFAYPLGYRHGRWTHSFTWVRIRGSQASWVSYMKKET